MSATSAGRASLLPDRAYDAPERITVLDASVEMRFDGSDNRQKTFSTKSWSDAALHLPIVQGIAAATGWSGTSRTERSASNLWSTSRRFVNFLGTLPAPPQRVRDIDASHLQGFVEHLTKTTKPGSAAPLQALRVLRTMFLNIPAEHRVGDDVLGFLSRRRSNPRKYGVSGMSDEVFRTVIAAARADVVDVRTRIRAGRALAQQQLESPEAVPETLARLAEQLAELLTTGTLERRPGESARENDVHAIAKQVFPVASDLTPMLILFAAMSGRNSETLKELPAKHVTFEDGALHIQVVKRRRGKDHWFEDVHWELGRPSRQLHTPGGIFKLFDELCAQGRKHAGTDRLWSIWMNPRPQAPTPNRYPWAASVQAQTLDLAGWVARHGITEDGEPLQLSFNRIRTTYLRRQTRDVGGHLPSVSSQNTQDVLFKNYLAGDSTTRAWADREIAATFVELEEQVRVERSTALITNGGRIASADAAEASDHSAYLSCRDIEHGPHNHGAPCGASALACFSCPNAIIGEEHLPKLVHLKSELEGRWGDMASAVWWSRYGAAWVALNDDILPRFTEAEIAEVTPDRTLKLKFLEDAA